MDQPEQNKAVLEPDSDQQRTAMRHKATDDQSVRQFVIDAARLIEDLRTEDIVIFDVRGLSDVTDYILIGSGTSRRQIKSVGGEVEDLAKKSGLVRYGRDADDDATWLVVDLVDVVVHLFEPVARAHYDLEMMWGDAPRVEWRRSKSQDSD